MSYEVFAENWIQHDLRPTAALPGPKRMVKIASDFRKAFPNLRFVADLMLAEDDLVAARWTAEGTHSGRWGPVKATGRRARFSGVNIFRIRDRRVVEMWNHRDDLGLMQQVGAPMYAGAAPEPDSRADPPSRGFDSDASETPSA